MSNGDDPGKSSGCLLLVGLVLVVCLIPLLRDLGLGRSETGVLIQHFFPGLLAQTGVSASNHGSFVDPAPKIPLPSPQASESPLPTQDVPTPASGGGGSTGGSHPTPPPAGCTPSAPNNITASAGHVSGSSNGNGGSWSVSGAPIGQVTISDSGMVSCGLHHTLARDTPSAANSVNKAGMTVLLQIQPTWLLRVRNR